MQKLIKYAIFRKEDGNYIDAECETNYTKNIDEAMTYYSYHNALTSLLNHFSLDYVMHNFEIHEVEVSISNVIIKRTEFKISDITT